MLLSERAMAKSMGERMKAPARMLKVKKKPSGLCELREALLTFFPFFQGAQVDGTHQGGARRASADLQDAQAPADPCFGAFLLACWIHQQGLLTRPFAPHARNKIASSKSVRHNWRGLRR